MRCFSRISEEGLEISKAVCGIVGIFLKSVDRFNEENEHDVSNRVADRSNTTPLLVGEKPAETESSSSVEPC